MVVVYDMPVQAMNTLHSLSPGHQRGVADHDYEVVVVENMSENTLDPAEVHALGANMRYLLRDEPGQSPAPAINAGARAARGRSVALLVDGARMVTPGVVSNILAAQRVAGTPVVSVPGYHLGEQLHQEAVPTGYTAGQEQEALAELDWRADGYRLFDMAVLSASCREGYLRPIGGEQLHRRARAGCSTHSAASTSASSRRGGGFVNLDFYRRRSRSRDTDPAARRGDLPPVPRRCHHWANLAWTVSDLLESHAHRVPSACEPRSTHRRSKRPILLGGMAATGDALPAALRRAMDRSQPHMTTEMSVVIVVYDMPQQALNTIRSFAVPYQLHVSSDDYEIIVVENESDHLLGEAAALVRRTQRPLLPTRRTRASSPVPALIHGISQARGRPPREW